MHLHWQPGSTQEHNNDSFDNDAFDFTNLSQTNHSTGDSHPQAHSDPLGVAAPDSLAGLVLVNGDGEVVSGPSYAGTHGASGTGGGTSGSSSTTGQSSTSPFVINVTYDASVANAPAAFKTAVANVVQYLESQYTDPVTINIAVGYGEVGGYKMGAGALGESLTYLSSYNYSDIKNALTSDAKSADDAATVATLPTTSPVSGTFWASTAESKALGLMGTSASLDGYVGFAAGNLFDYDNSNGISAGLYDFYGTVAHEITEVMGRALLVGGSIGNTPNGYYPLDLFHYSANGVHDYSGTTPGYFSIDGGATNLNSFNTNPGGDFGDWASSAGNDSFNAYSASGVVNSVSQADLRELDVLGWDAASTGSTQNPPPPPPSTQPDLTVTGFSFSGAQFSYHVINVGDGAASSSTVGIYSSSSPTGTQTLIGTMSTAALGPGASDTETGTITWGAGTTGTYYINVAADYQNLITESNESNNQSARIALVLGNSSANKLVGTSAGDILIGMGGKDTLTGGTGSDQFVFNTAVSRTSSAASITDFSHAQGDKIDLDHTIFTALNFSGVGTNLASSDFYASSNGTAHLATDHVLYNTSTGALFYDADGTGRIAPIQIATLGSHPALTASDFLLV